MTIMMIKIMIIVMIMVMMSIGKCTFNVSSAEDH